MDASSNKSRPSLPANYVSILDLRERWIQKRSQEKPCEDDDGNKQPRLNSELLQHDLSPNGEDEADADPNKLRPPEKSLLRWNRNPRSSNRRISLGSRRPIDTSRCRWVQVADPKTLPEIRVRRSKKPPPSDPPKVECEQNDERKDVARLQAEKGIEDGKGNSDVDGVKSEIEGKLAGLCLSSGGKSVAVRNRSVFRKGKERGYGRFGGRARESGLVWVKKGETCNIFV